MTLNFFAKCSVLTMRGAALAALLILAACTSGPPVQEMSDARQAIAVAREAGASEYSPEELRQAEDHLDSALRNLTHKEYRLARQNAVEAKNAALAALQRTERAVTGEPQP